MSIDVDETGDRITWVGKAVGGDVFAGGTGKFLINPLVSFTRGDMEVTILLEVRVLVPGAWNSDHMSRCGGLSSASDSRDRYRCWTLNVKGDSQDTAAPITYSING